MEVLTIHPKNNEQLEAIKSVLKALKIPFEKDESPYDPEFVKMIRNAEKDRKNSTVLKTKEDIEKFFEEL
jgi:antitoxin component of RelBE/YafQ-DinJ toxin-antitoxin module